MKITHLFRKPAKKQPLEVTDTLRMIRAHGIEGDQNAHGASPRQVLITRQEDIVPLSIKAGELRENIVVEGMDLAAFQPGSLVKIGEAAIRLTYQCAPCPQVKHLVDSLTQLNDKRGILGVVIAGGTIQVGDAVAVQKAAYAPIIEDNFELFKAFVSRIPEGKIVTYHDAIKGMGGYKAFLRKLPDYIERLGTDAPSHRIVNDSGKLTSYIAQQKEKLTAEGVDIQGDKLDVAQFRWASPAMFMD